MPRVDGSSSSAVPPPSTGEASASHANPHPDANLRQRPVRTRAGALADLPVPRAAAPRVQAGDTAVAAPARGRVAATLDRVRGAGQVLANVGAQAAEVGGHVGQAIGRQLWRNPVMTMGVGSMATGLYLGHRADARGDIPGFARAVSLTITGAGMTLMATIGLALRANTAPLRVDPNMLLGAATMLTGNDPHNMAVEQEAGAYAPNVFDHIHDIAELPASRLHPAVRNAALVAGGNPQQLVRNLLGVMTGDTPVFSSRRPPPGDLSTLGVNPLALHDAVSRLTGFAEKEEDDLTAEAGGHTQDVVDHLQDIAARPANTLHPAVRRAAEAAGDDAQQLVRNLVAMMQHDPSILPTRRQAPAR